eukprot:gb/GEZN01003801.1/.p1 GENE.gb/GEZN01003801.1/~~gb/GEZN01003801.1/.p1  ORF type:complete len:641 (+),score=31.40 gb/GEZN01003801.1/:98-1924(+)
MFAVYMAKKWQDKTLTTEDFITARGQVPMWRLGWSFFAGAIGAWVIASPAAYASSAGMLGLVFYSLSSGLPVLLIAYAGPIISKAHPSVLSLTDFMGHRFGCAVQNFTFGLMVFNMAIAMLAEYVTLGTLWQVYLGAEKGEIIIFVVGILTMTYTTAGGLLVSVLTDQVQGICSLTLLFVVAIYMAKTFRFPFVGECSFGDGYITACSNCSDMKLPLDEGSCAYKKMPNNIAGFTEYGYSSIFVMPVSLFTATIYSEAMWQRAWAAESPRKLKQAAILGAFAITLLVFVSGLIGWLGAWAGLIPPDANANIYIFYGLNGAVNPETGTVANGIGVLVLLLAVIMSEGAIDSMQNGLQAAVSSHLLRSRPLWTTRVFVLLINIPLMILGAIGLRRGWAILDLFLVANMVCCCCATPVLLGLYRPVEPLFHGPSFLSSCLLSFLCVSLLGIGECWNDSLVYDPAAYVYTCVPHSGPPPTVANNIGTGMEYAWLHNGYRWDYFLVALMSSVGGCLLAVAFNYYRRRRNPQIAIEKSVLEDAAFNEGNYEEVTAIDLVPPPLAPLKSDDSSGPAAVSVWHSVASVTNKPQSSSLLDDETLTDNLTSDDEIHIY